MLCTTSHRVGLVGLMQSGKTTFATSLIDQWVNHCPPRFPLGKKRPQLSVSWEGDPSGERRYEVNRQRIQEGSWLDKTLQCESYNLKIKQGGRFRQHRICIYDLPGERLGDVAIFKHKSLLEWSDEIVHQLELDGLKMHSKDFLQILRRDADPSEEWLKEIDNAYRELMVRLLRTSNPFITPSSVLVDACGKYVPAGYLTGEKDISDWVKKHSCFGLEGTMIAPLPHRFASSEILKKRQLHYKNYRKSVVLPAFKRLAVCQDVIVLVDLAAILAMGPNWKNLTTSFLKTLVATIVPRSALSKHLMDASNISSLGLLGQRVERITFVASQADRIWKGDRNNLQALLQDLVTPATRYITSTNRVQIEYGVASAIESTVSTAGHNLEYERLKDKKPSKIQVSQVPTEFGNTWNPQDFQFPLPRPRVPDNRAVPPKQFGLERITERILRI